MTNEIAPILDKLNTDEIEDLINENINTGTPRRAIIKHCQDKFSLSRRDATLLIDFIEEGKVKYFENRISKLFALAVDRHEFLFGLFMKEKNYAMARATNNDILKLKASIESNKILMTDNKIVNINIQTITNNDFLKLNNLENRN